MNKKKIAKVLKEFTDKQLEDELNRRARKRKGKVLGYRVEYPGDEYNYGCYEDFRIGEIRNGKLLKTKTDAAFMALKTAEKGSCVSPYSQGQISEIYKNTLKPKRIN